MFPCLIWLSKSVRLSSIVSRGNVFSLISVFSSSVQCWSTLKLLVAFKLQLFYLSFRSWFSPCNLPNSFAFLLSTYSSNRSFLGNEADVSLFVWTFASIGGDFAAVGLDDLCLKMVGMLIMYAYLPLRKYAKQIRCQDDRQKISHPIVSSHSIGSFGMAYIKV